MTEVMNFFGRGWELMQRRYVPDFLYSKTASLIDSQMK